MYQYQWDIYEWDKHLCLFSKQNIEKYEEICYDYNAPDLWWRKKVLSYYCCLVKCGYCWSMEQKTNTVKWLWTKWTLVTLLLKIEQRDRWKCNFQGFKWSKMQIYQGNLAPGLMLEATYMHKNRLFSYCKLWSCSELLRCLQSKT